MRAALAACLLAALAGCSKRSSNSYVNDEHDISIDFPPDWNVQEGFMGSIVLATEPTSPGDDVAENINIVMEHAPGVSAGEYWDAARAMMDRILTDLERGESGSETIDGHEAHWVVYRHRMGQMTFRVLAYALVDDGRAFVVTCTAAPDAFEAYEPRFRKIVRTLRFE